MKINVNQRFKSINNTFICDDEKKEIPRTLKDVLTGAVLQLNNTDTPQERYDKYGIYQRIKESEVILELSAEEITMFKKVIGESQPPLIVGPAWDMLEGEIVDPNPKPKPPPPPPEQ